MSSKSANIDYLHFGGQHNIVLNMSRQNLEYSLEMLYLLQAKVRYAIRDLTPTYVKHIIQNEILPQTPLASPLHFLLYYMYDGDESQYGLDAIMNLAAQNIKLVEDQLRDQDLWSEGKAPMAPKLRLKYGRDLLVADIAFVDEDDKPHLYLDMTKSQAKFRLGQLHELRRCLFSNVNTLELQGGLPTITPDKWPEFEQNRKKICELLDTPGPAIPEIAAADIKRRKVNSQKYWLAEPNEQQTAHQCNKLNLFKSFHIDHNACPNTDGGPDLHIFGYGDIDVTFLTASGEEVPITLKDVEYVPQSKRNIISLYKLCLDLGAGLKWPPGVEDEEEFVVVRRKEKEQLAWAKFDGRDYYLQLSETSKAQCRAMPEQMDLLPFEELWTENRLWGTLPDGDQPGKHPNIEVYEALLKSVLINYPLLKAQYDDDTMWRKVNRAVSEGGDEGSANADDVAKPEIKGKGKAKA